MKTENDQPDGEKWTKREWLSYYSECRQFLLALGQKFVSLLAQASVFAFASCTVILAAREKLNIVFPRNLLLALPAIAGLALYIKITSAYSRQLKGIGRIMEEIETEHLVVPPELRLLQTLRRPEYAFFASPTSYRLVQVYYVALPLIIAGSVWVTRE